MREQSTGGRRLFRRSAINKAVKTPKATPKHVDAPVETPTAVEVPDLPVVKFDTEEVSWLAEPTPEPQGLRLPSFSPFAQAVEDVELPDPETAPEPEPEPLSLEDAITSALSSGTSLSKVALAEDLSDHARLKGLDSDKAQAVVYRTLNKLKADNKVERVGSPKDATWKATEL